MLEYHENPPGREARPMTDSVTDPDYDPFASELEATAPATPQQREIWSAAQLGPEASAAYNLPAALRFRGSLDIEMLRSALEALVERHDALRLSFAPDGETVCFARHVVLPLVIETCDEPGCEAILLEEGAQPFDLVNGPLVRARLLRVAPDDHLLVVTAHHVCWDGWSISVFFRELLEIYGARQRGEEPGLPPAPRFRDYALRCASAQHIATCEIQERAWLERLADMPDFLPLPTDHLRPALRSFRAGGLQHELSPEARGALEALCELSGSTLFITLATCFFGFLHRLSGSDRLVVGVPAAGQVNACEPGLVGHCVSMLPVPSRMASGQTFREFLADTRECLLDATEDRDCSFGPIVERLKLPRDAATVPLVQVVFNLDRAPVLPDAGIDCEFSMPPKPFENFEWFVNVVAGDDSVALECLYKTDLFDADVMRQRMRELECFILSAATHPDTLLEQLRLVPDEELLGYGSVVRLPSRNGQGGEQAVNGILVADDAGQPLPVGVAGELVIKGDVPARHFLDGEQELKSAIFEGVTTTPVEPGDYYFTGERAALHVDGQLELLGSQSHHIRVRGRPIEPARIEALVRDCGVRAVAVVPDRERPGSLVAHVEDCFLPADTLWSRLADILPAWMVPNRIVLHERLPRLVDGRIDREALGRLATPDVPQGDDSSLDEAASRVAACLSEAWREVIGIPSIGLHDNFFEIGGHSLLAARIVALMRERWNVTVPMSSIFLAPTIAELARREEMQGLASVEVGNSGASAVTAAREEFEL